MAEELEREENGRKPKKVRQPKGSTSTKSNTVPLSWPQVQKLWAIVMGGQLIDEFDEDSGETVYHVGIESFGKALPVLLEKL